MNRSVTCAAAIVLLALGSATAEERSAIEPTPEPRPVVIGDRVLAFDPSTVDLARFRRPPSRRVQQRNAEEWEGLQQFLFRQYYFNRAPHDAVWGQANARYLKHPLPPIHPQ